MRILLTCIIVVSIHLYSNAQKFEVDTIFFSGNSEKHINMVILPDGYQEAELEKFKTDAENFVNVFFTVPPFNRYSSYFNVFTIKVPSNESGADHPGTAIDVTEPEHPVEDVDNFFGSTFDYYDIHRLLVPLEEGKIFNVLATNFPLYDQAIILANTPYYGGSGGSFATASLHQQSIEVTIHELGHSFAGLSDEYYAGDFYAGESVNMTKETDPEKVKWKNWIGTDDVGIYQHCCGDNSAEWYRPHQSCKMRVLGAPFCPVCKQAIVERIHNLVSPIANFSPENTNLTNEHETINFEVDLIKPEPNTLKNIWEFNGEVVDSTGDLFVLKENELEPGLNFVAVYVEDTSDLLRIDIHNQIHLSSVLWTIQNNELGSEEVNGTKNQISINLYPNPVANRLNIEINSKTPYTSLLTGVLTNISGSEVRRFPLNSGEVNQVNLDLLNPGTYGVDFYAGKVKIASRKIIVK